MRMRLGSVLVLAVTAMALASPAVAQMKSSGSLYERVGGYDAIAAVTDDFIGRLVMEPKLKQFFGGHSDDSKVRLRQHVIDFLCNATGGPCLYAGRDMKTAHKGLGITKDHWTTAVNHLIATMDKFKVPEKEKNELLSAVGPLEKDIVEKM